jgi:hypothetical protein
VARRLGWLLVRSSSTCHSISKLLAQQLRQTIAVSVILSAFNALRGVRSVGFLESSIARSVTERKVI